MPVDERDRRTRRLEVVEVLRIDRGEFDPVPSAREVRAGDLYLVARYGLTGMQARADLVGAELRIDSKPGKGTRVSITVPVSAPLRR